MIASFFFGVAWMKHWYLYLLLTNLLLPLHIPRPVAFDPLWSLAVEEQFYLVWPFAVYFLDERQLRRLAILVMAVAPLLRSTFHFAEHWPIYTLTPFRMDLLAAGALLWLERERSGEALKKRGSAIGLLLTAAGLTGLGLLAHFGVTTYGNTRTGNALIYESSLLVCVGFMLYALAGKWVGWLRIKPLVYIGQISYSMYLVHLGVLTLMPKSLSMWAAAAVAFAITVAYASLSWHLLESRLLQRMRQPASHVISA